MNENPSLAVRLRRILHRLTGRDAAERLAAIERVLRRSSEAQRGESAERRSTQAALARLTDRTRDRSTKETAALREVRDALQALAERVANGEDPLFAQGRRSLRRELERVASGRTPILVGPWTGEVGFELLYWIPFVRWTCAEFGIDPRRLVVVSRGGVASWYGVPAEQYVDIFSLIDPERFRTATAAGVSLKQRERGPLDDEIVDTVIRQHGLDPEHVLHPRMMFRAFRNFWEDEVGYERIDEFTKHALLVPPGGSGPVGLPSEYVVVRFYFRRSFPDTPANRAFAESVVLRLAQTTPVVVLASGVRVDDHSDWKLAMDANRIVVADTGPAHRNLEVQSAIISRARAFVGTYGGFAYLAPLYGVPSVAFYSRRAFRRNHLYVAHRVFEEIGAATLTEMHVSQADLIGSALGGAPHEAWASKKA
ncbi:MAG TPA: hypothetical protein VG871_06825 [Vicinamibacterales bacterium]|nr:hypothetical protein [Vicinamibacterales bacterium]